MKKVMLVFGTRPDAIKMCPLVSELKRRPDVETVVCVSGQHREMLKDVLSVFDIEPDYDLDIMKVSQRLSTIAVNVIIGMDEVLKRESPNIVLVHGDTSTAFSAALCCFYSGITVGHIEAGLRSGDVFDPFPEEFHRKAIALMSTYDFAPTESAAQNLISEGKSGEQIFITGNTVADSVRMTVGKSNVIQLFEYDDEKPEKSIVPLPGM